MGEMKISKSSGLFIVGYSEFDEEEGFCGSMVFGERRGFQIFCKREMKL